MPPKYLIFLITALALPASAVVITRQPDTIANGRPVTTTVRGPARQRHLLPPRRIHVPCPA